MDSLGLRTNVLVLVLVRHYRAAFELFGLPAVWWPVGWVVSRPPWC